MKKERSLIRKIYPESSIKKINKKMELLGITQTNDTTKFLKHRIILSICGFLLFLIPLKHGYIIAPIIAILSYFGYEYLTLDLPIKTRRKKLEREAIFYFEILLLSLESGKNLYNAIEITSKNVDSELAREFQKTLNEVKIGKSFTESIRDMKKRIPSETINNAILNMTESSVYGNSIEESLKNQLDYLKEKRLLEIKGEISKLPTKISVISVLFFIPILLLIILAPVVLAFLFG